MEVFKKFIIETDPEEGDCLIIAKCTYHKQLASDITKVKGGGLWDLDYDNNIFTLFGESHDFGEADFEDIKNCVNNGKCFRNKSLYATYNKDDFKFLYKNRNGIIVEL